jgi:hypothetical protein
MPNGFFRLLLQKSYGSAIGIPLGAGKISGTNDTGKAPMLCANCEGDFNSAWDAPLVNALKNLDSKIVSDGFSARVKFNHDQCAQAIASIVWRSCMSDASMYQGAAVNNRHLNDLVKIMNADRGTSLKLCSISLRRLWGKPERQGGAFDQSSINQIIVPPTARTFAINGRARGFGFDFVVQGFLIHITVPRLPHSKVRTSGFLRSGGTLLHAPTIGIFDYQPLVDVLVQAYAKYVAGEVSGKAAR